jgi:hypothetical protein
MAAPLLNPPVGFDQPPGGGSNYPFTGSSIPMSSVFADFFISHSGTIPSMQQGLRIGWVHGFGSLSNPLIPGRPLPTHSHDLIVEDSSGTVIFDTTTATAFHSYRGDRDLLVVEWRTSQYIIRATTRVPHAGSGSAQLSLGAPATGKASHYGTAAANLPLGAIGAASTIMAGSGSALLSLDALADGAAN